MPAFRLGQCSKRSTLGFCLFTSGPESNRRQSYPNSPQTLKMCNQDLVRGVRETKQFPFLTTK